LTRPKRLTIAVTPVTYNALHSLAKYRETLDDVVLKSLIAYANSMNVKNEFVIYAISEADSRFADKINHIDTKTEGAKPKESSEDILPYA
jgi:hypothetical protein